MSHGHDVRNRAATVGSGWSLHPDNRLLTRAAVCRESRAPQSRDRREQLVVVTGQPLADARGSVLEEPCTTEPRPLGSGWSLHPDNRLLTRAALCREIRSHRAVTVK